MNQSNSETEISEEGLKKAIHRATIEKGILPGSDLLRDYGFSMAVRVSKAVEQLLEDKAVDIRGDWVPAEPKSVFRATLSVKPNNKQFSKSLLNKR